MILSGNDISSITIKKNRNEHSDLEVKTKYGTITAKNIILDGLSIGEYDMKSLNSVEIQSEHVVNLNIDGTIYNRSITIISNKKGSNDGEF